MTIVKLLESRVRLLTSLKYILLIYNNPILDPRTISGIVCSKITLYNWYNLVTMFMCHYKQPSSKSWESPKLYVREIIG